MKLIDADSRRQAWKHFSTWGLIILWGLPLVWDQIPADTKARMPVETRDWIQILIAMWAIGGKFVEQKPRPPRKPRSRP